ncbi:MAG: site-specific integrase [Phycisphaerae bacterium]|jgi:integrase
MSAWKIVESDILSRREVERIWAELCRKSARSLNTRQTRVIFCLATFCGLRNSEICGLRLRDAKLDIPRPVLDVPAGVAKGLKARQVPLWRLPTALACLSAWKAERRGQGAGAMDRLVCAQSCSARGRPLDRRNARARFISACRVLGPERQGMLTIHCGRHTCASHLLAAGWPLPAVRDLMGHANLWTTNLYAHVIVDDAVPPDPFAFAAGPTTVA